MSLHICRFLSILSLPPAMLSLWAVLGVAVVVGHCKGCSGRVEVGKRELPVPASGRWWWCTLSR